MPAATSPWTSLWTSHCRGLLLLLGTLLLGASAAAQSESVGTGTTWFVDASGTGLGTGTADQPFTNISYGVSRSFVQSGDEFLVAPGVYGDEEIDFLGKSLRIRSSAGPDVTTVIARPQTGPSNPYPAMRLAAGEQDVVIEGLRITGGTGSRVCTGFTQVVGGAIEVCTGASLTVRNCHFDGNTAERGGAIYAKEAQIRIENSVFRGPGTEARGEAVYLLNSQAVIVESTFEDLFLVSPDVPRGGGAVVADNSTLLLNLCTFQRNATRFFGAHLWSRSGDVTVDRCEFGQSTGYAGASISASGGAMRILNTTVRFGRGIQAPGAGLFASNADVLVEDSLFEANVVDGTREGGGIAVQSGRLTVSGTRFLRNTSGQGGGIAVSQSTNTLITDCEFVGNAGRSGGGALFCGDTHATVEHCVFTGNAALPNGPGGAIQGRAAVGYCSFSGNAAGDPGGAAADMAHLFRSIAWGNAPSDLDDSCSAAESLVGQGGAALTVDPVNGNPLFWSGSDLHLLPGSAAIDAASALSGFDPDGSPMEIGAFPFESSYCPPDCAKGLGVTGCVSQPNSTDQIATLRAFGSDEVAANRLLVLSERLPGNIATLVLASRSGGLINVPGMVGPLCLSAPFFRLLNDVRPSRPDGTAPTWVRLHAPGGNPGEAGLTTQPGDTWYFQLWYRDMTSGGMTNTSNSLRVMLR